MKQFKLPDLGEGLQEAEIVEWHVQVGDQVEVDQLLVSVETAKAIVDVPSPYDGVISRCFGKPGDLLHVGEPLVGFEGEAEDSGTVVGNLGGASGSSDLAADDFHIGAAPSTRDFQPARAAPAVRALARKLDVDLGRLSGSGANGLITEQDVRSAAEVPAGFEGTALRSVRRTMAKNMARAHAEVVPVMIVEDADLHAWPTDARDPIIRLARAIARACLAEPALNVAFDGRRLSIRTHDQVDLGVAVDTPDGLFVPVLRDVAGEYFAANLNRVVVLVQFVAQRRVADRAGHALVQLDLVQGRRRVPGPDLAAVYAVVSEIFILDVAVYVADQAVGLHYLRVELDLNLHVAPDYFQRAKDGLLIFVMIETRKALDNLDENALGELFARHDDARRRNAEAGWRAAYGETGNLPTFGQKFTNLGTPQLGGQQGITVSTTSGFDGVEPERLKEIEFGADGWMMDGRLNWELTGFERNTTNLLLQRVPAPSSGFVSQTFNGGKIRNSGIEAALGYTPIQTERTQWTTRGTFTKYTSEVEDLAGQPAFFPASSGFGNLGRTRIEEGRSITQIVGFGLNPDGTPTPTLVELGNSAPDFRVGFVNDITFGIMSLNAVVDWQKGGDVINLTQFLYDDAENSADHGSAAWERRMAGYLTGSIEPYIEDASFVKLREVSIGADLPSSLYAPVMGSLDRVRVSVSGRNLWMWKRYSGLDPEVANFGPAAVRNNLDISPYPPSRSFFLNISVGF